MGYRGQPRGATKQWTRTARPERSCRNDSVTHELRKRTFFEWDAEPSDATRAARGFDFEYAARIFSKVSLFREVARRDYGGRRYLARGRADDDVPVVVCVRRGQATRIICARKANWKERDRFQDHRAAR